MEEDILNYLYQLSCFEGHPVLNVHTRKTEDTRLIKIYLHCDKK